MKQYTADKHAQYTLQIATPIVTAVLIGLIWYFLAVLPHWLLWTLTAVLAAAAILLSTLLLPMWFCTVTYCVSATHITRKCGIFFIQEQVMRTQALQFSSIFQAPFADATGMNFIPLHAYGGTVILSFLSSSDAAEIQAFLQKTVYSHSLPPEIPQTFRRSRSSMPLKVRCSRRQELAAMRKIRRKGAVHDTAWDCR